MNLKKVLIVTSVSVLVLSSCTQLDATPDPTQGIGGGVKLDTVEVIDGQSTTNVVIEETSGLGLNLEEASKMELPSVVTSSVSQLNPTVQISAPQWGELVSNPVQVNFALETPEDLILRWFLNGVELLPSLNASGSFFLGSLDKGEYILQGIVVGDGHSYAHWDVAFGVETAVTRQFGQPILTVLQPAQDVVYEGEIPFWAHLSQADLSPGVRGLRVLVNEEVFWFFDEGRHSIPLSPGEYLVDLSVVDLISGELLPPLGPKSFTVEVK